MTRWSRPPQKSQSAMEYLMTYGWAILIIAVVLGAIYSLGLFNGVALAPRAQPGSCQVIRPNGPGTSQYASLAGACTNQLPQFVASADGTAGAYILTTGSLPSLSQGTVVGWLKVSSLWSSTPYGSIASASQSGNGCGTILYQNGGATFLSRWWFGATGCVPNPNVGGNYLSPNLPTNKWVMIAYAFDTSGNVKGYGFTQSLTANSVDSQSPFVTSQTPWLIGSWAYTGPVGQAGSIADVQIYNTTLDANAITALYQEGIGGRPINLQGLLAWWPLNGNCNDYSGNGYNCQTHGNVIFTNQWSSGYALH